MFGKPDWFKDKKVGWGLTPIKWQGWAYTLVWGAVIAGPFLLLISRENGMGAGVWMLAAMGGLIWDVWQIKRARYAPPVAAAKKKEPVLYIGDDEATELSTKNLDMQLRR
jgi:hypothetical protein